MRRRTVAALLAGAVALGLMVGCAPSGKTCVQARIAHVTVKGCPR